MIWIEKIFSRPWAQPAKNWVAGPRLTEGGGPHLSKAQKARLGKKRTYRSTQERPSEGGSCRGSALPNYDELEMDRPTLGNGIMDARFQSSSPIRHRFVSKVRTDRILMFDTIYERNGASVTQEFEDAIYLLCVRGNARASRFSAMRAVVLVSSSCLVHPYHRRRREAGRLGLSVMTDDRSLRRSAKHMGLKMA
jgi:hypothetical protein